MQHWPLVLFRDSIVSLQSFSSKSKRSQKLETSFAARKLELCFGRNVVGDPPSLVAARDRDRCDNASKTVVVDGTRQRIFWALKPTPPRPMTPLASSHGGEARVARYRSGRRTTRRVVPLLRAYFAAHPEIPPFWRRHHFNFAAGRCHP